MLSAVTYQFALEVRVEPNSSDEQLPLYDPPHIDSVYDRAWRLPLPLSELSQEL